MVRPSGPQKQVRCLPHKIRFSMPSVVRAMSFPDAGKASRRTHRRTHYGGDDARRLPFEPFPLISLPAEDEGEDEEREA